MSHSDTQSAARPSEVRKWEVAITLALFYSLPVIIYVWAFSGTLATVTAWNAVTAGVAGCLLATALSASSWYYYTGWPNMRWGYQKQIGVLAFWLCVLYCVQLLYIEPDVYWYGFWDNLATPNFFYGLSAMTIFAAMTFANTEYMKQYISWNTVKFILGLGFVGYALLVIRAVFLEWPIWATWLQTFSGLPTTRFVLSALAVSVLLFRLSIPVHAAIFRRDKHK